MRRSAFIGLPRDVKPAATVRGSGYHARVTESAQEPTPTREPGTVVSGRYEIRRLVGRGGMGEVYAALNRGTGREVALKTIRTATPSAEQTRRLLREAKASNAIGHPNVIDVLDVFEDTDGTPVLVMELLAGETLSARLRREGKLTLAQVAAVFVPVASALQAAHDKGIVHRDLKPDNVFLARNVAGKVVPKVLDFGIAKVIDPAAVMAETEGASTHTGSILGTPHYMSLEQAMSEKDIDRRTDVWSLGVMLYEALVGQRPFAIENLGQMYAALLTSPVPAIREQVPGLPDEVASVIERCLVKDRGARLDDVGAVIAALVPHADGELAAVEAARSEPWSATASTVKPLSRDPGEPRRRGRVAAVVVLAAAAVVGAVVVGSRAGAPATGVGPPSAAPSALATAASSPDAIPSAPSVAPSVAVEQPTAPRPSHTAKAPPPPASAKTTAAASAPPPPPVATGLYTGDPYKAPPPK
jgi:eukaryotic-like serine/threonine-protein kinase